MTFAKPNLLWMLLIIPVITGIFILLQINARKKLIRIIPRRHWPTIIPGLCYKQRAWIYTLYLLSFIFLILACAQPQYGFKIIKTARKGINIFIALDTSTSMLAKDVLPNRFTLAKQEIIGLINNLKGDQIGLILFSGDSFIQCPLTLDYNSIMMFLENSQIGSIPKPGSNLAQAIKTARLNFKKYKSGQNILIIFTDGENFENDPIASAKVASKENIKIFPIGLGKSDGEPIPIFNNKTQLIGYKKDKDNKVIFSKLNEKVLKEIAKTTQGNYYHANGRNSVSSQLYKTLSNIEKKHLKNQIKKNHIHRYQSILFLCLITFILSLIIREAKE
ncbi:MAG: VWA domain-containing protein [bacterium]